MTMTDTEKLEQEYLDAMGSLDEVLNCLTREFCATSCNQGEYGCCRSKTMYSEDSLDISNIKEKQRKEAESNGWQPHDNDCCLYLNDDGCKLRLYKPAICIGHICGDIEDALAKTFKDDSDTVRDFILIMDSIAYEFFGSKVGKFDGNINQELKKASELGRKLIEKVPACYTPAEYIKEMNDI